MLGAYISRVSISVVCLLVCPCIV